MARWPLPCSIPRAFVCCTDSFFSWWPIMDSSCNELNYRQLYEGWNVVNALCANSDCGLPELLARVFDHLGALDWLFVERRGAILLATAHDELVLSAHYGFTEGHAAHCERVALSRCACGQVVQKRRMGLMECAGDQALAGRPQSAKGHHFVLPLMDQHVVLGVMTLFVPSGHQPGATEIAMMEKLAETLSVIVARRNMEEVLLVTQLEINASKRDTIHHLGKAAEYRDNETGLHILRMSHYAGVIAKKMGLSPEECEILTIAAPMHDVGKIGIPDNILLKPAGLTAAELEVIQGHPAIGWQILEGDDELIRAARDIALSHHEKWNGSGYPNGLKGEEISLYGRISCLADVFDALTSPRPYKSAWPVEEAVSFIKKESGQLFDPKLVAAFLEGLPEILRIRVLFRDDIIDPREKLSLSPLPEPVGCWIPWSGDYSVAIDTLDEHHQYLFRLTNTLHDTISKRQGSKRIATILAALKQYSIIHFGEEERMMRHYGYPRLDSQVSEHRYFIKKLDEFWGSFKKSPLSLGFDMIYFLRDWLINHIVKEDKQLAALKVTP